MKAGLTQVLVCSVLLLFSGQIAALAQPVTLQSANRSVSLSGNLVDYDGEFYRIDTRFGTMTVRALGVTCLGAKCPDPGQYAADITIAGDGDSIANILPPMLEDFAFSSGLQSLRTDHRKKEWTYFLSDSDNVPVARIQSKTSSSSQALNALIRDQSDLAVTIRSQTPDQMREARIAGLGNLASRYQQQIIALDALVFLVSPENPVNALSIKELSAIYTGKITNWAEVGGFNAPIRRVRQPAGSDIGVAFTRLLVKSSSGEVPAKASLLENGLAVSKAVRADPFAIGFTNYAAIRNAKPLSIRGACGIRQAPTRFSIKAGDYPLVLPHYLFRTNHRLPVNTRAFLSYLTHRKGQSAVEATGYVGQNLEVYPLSKRQEFIANALRLAGGDVSLSALRKYVLALSDASRVSTSFRYGQNHADLDAASRRGLRQFAEQIELGAFDGRELIFAGFSDSLGSASGNRRVSRQRAEKLANMVRTAASRADLSKIKFKSIGFGEVAPVACNDTEQGRTANRRVEIWVK